MKHLSIKIYGKVQGVFFRQSAYEEASRLGINGTVKNIPDGTVLVEAEADEDKLEEFLDWCKSGPEHAYVEKIETTPGEVQNYQGFQIA
ncbi:acylphosphatase [Candidatus Parcubacteria bacterium]|nr:acylphosphatase [Candidatus Parcubacteria bacterium]